ncbi:hypothetical protein AB0G14_22475, partial [Micromonospora sp. NPDC023814]
LHDRRRSAHPTMIQPERPRSSRPADEHLTSHQSGTWYAGGQQIRMWCNMTYGSSGGPWLQEYNDQNGLGYVNSVVSHGDNPGNGQFDGPYFDNDIKSLYDFAEGLSPA